MPLVDIHLIEGVFDKSQKQAMINKVTNAMVEVEGEAMRGVTWGGCKRRMGHRRKSIERRRRQGDANAQPITAKLVRTPRGV
jgi:hypothetical protein